MLSEITGFQAIYIYCGKCGLRKGIDGLATLVKEQFHLDPFQKDVLRQDYSKTHRCRLKIIYQPFFLVERISKGSTQFRLWQNPYAYFFRP